MTQLIIPPACAKAAQAGYFHVGPQDEPLMSPSQRAENAAFLCCHFSRNLAYYNAGRKVLPLDREGFWLTTMGNCIDVCVLEWCKLFGNRNGKYHWRNVLHAPDDFKISFLGAMHLSQHQFDLLHKRVKDYRDEFVAHLEDNETTTVPVMSVPYILVSAYYRQLCDDFPSLATTEALPRDLGNYFLRQIEEASEVYRLFDANMTTVRSSGIEAKSKHQLGGR